MVAKKGDLVSRGRPDVVKGKRVVCFCLMLKIQVPKDLFLAVWGRFYDVHVLLIFAVETETSMLF